MRVFILSLFMCNLAFAEPTVISLWENGAPGFESLKDTPELIKPRTENEHNTFPITTNIHNPSLIAYFPTPEKATGASVIIAPGGGHMFLTMGREGTELAEWLQDQGIAAFVLKYRLARADDSPYSLDHCVEDGRRAVRVVRAHASEWKVDPQRIGMIGFSAGGRPTLGTAAKPDTNDPGKADRYSAVSAKLNFIALVYAEVPKDTVVTGDFPPSFIAVTWDDDPKVTALTKLFLNLKENNVSAELHAYSKGGHGYGVAKRPIPVSEWPEQYLAWMKASSLLD